ncbi:MAG: hypothetical protein K8R50_06870 [Betaproteobacteria bacterium]|nr:hypothetical protein [Betaproteobacteria bacterium]
MALRILYFLYYPISLGKAARLEHEWMHATDPQASSRPVGKGHYVN